MLQECITYQDTRGLGICLSLLSNSPDQFNFLIKCQAEEDDAEEAQDKRQERERDLKLAMWIVDEVIKTNAEIGIESQLDKAEMIKESLHTIK